MSDDQILVGNSRAVGIDVGVIMLDNNLPRPLGDVGNARTFDFPIAYDVCAGAETTLVVERNAAGLLDAVRETGRRLRELGVRAITTCCGFLAIYQRELAATTDVPVATSSLLQIPTILRMLATDQKVCVLTVNASTLTDAHFAAVGVTEEDRTRIVLAGLENTQTFYPMIVGTRPDLNVAAARDEVVAAAKSAIDAAPEIGAFVFECTNLPPYSAAVREATGRPVWDARTLIDWLQAGVAS